MNAYIDERVVNLILDLEKIEAAPQGDARIEALRKAAVRSDDVIWYFRMATDPALNFYVRKLPDVAVSWSSECVTVERVDLLLKNLATKELSGNAAKTAIAKLLADCDVVSRKWFGRLLIRKLEIGIGAEAVNKAVPGLIKKHVVALATEVRKVKPKDLLGRWWQEIKFDGARVEAHLAAEGGPVTLLSGRKGRVMHGCESVRAALQALNEQHPYPVERVLDGEMVAMVDGVVQFQAMQKNLGKKAGSGGAESGDLHYVVFDGSTIGEWNNPKAPHETRYAFVKDLLSKLPSSKYSLVGYKEVTDPTMDYLMAECMAAVERGEEGVMLRRPHLPVEMKRSKSLIKVKLYDDFEAVVLGVEEGEHGKRGTCGKLVCSYYWPRKGDVTFRVGSGLTDAESDAYWKDPSSIIGKVGTIRCFGFTEDGMPRQPRWKGVRDESDTPEPEEDEE